jgi:VWA domain-containing protein
MCNTYRVRLVFFLVIVPGCFGQVAHESVLCNVVSSPRTTASTSAVKFSVSVAGTQVSELSVTPSQGVRRTMILLDSSGSMGQSNSSIKLAMQVAKDFIETSPQTDQLALLDFSNRTYIDIALTNVDSFRKNFFGSKDYKTDTPERRNTIIRCDDRCCRLSAQDFTGRRQFICYL